MWRPIFLALGLTLCLWGLECLVVERAVLSTSETVSAGDPLAPIGLAASDSSRVIEPPEWAPWSLLSAGGIVVLYSLMLKPGSAAASG